MIPLKVDMRVGLDDSSRRMKVSVCRVVFGGTGKRRLGEAVLVAEFVVVQRSECVVMHVSGTK